MAWNKMEIFLRYFSDPLADVRVERSTVSKIFSSVLNQIVAKSEDWIKFSCTIKYMDQAKTDWTSKFRILTAIGAVDCTPRAYNKTFGIKGKTIINVQRTCDANEKNYVLMLNGHGVYMAVGFGNRVVFRT